MTARKIMVIRHAEKPDDADTVSGVTLEGHQNPEELTFAVGSVREPSPHSSHPQMPILEISASRSHSRSSQVMLPPTVRAYAPNIL